MRLPIVRLDPSSGACPDLSIAQLSTLPNRHVHLLWAWLCVAIAVERTVDALSVVHTLRWRHLRLRAWPSYTPPSALLTAWNLLTSLSVFLVLVTERSALAVYLKSLHVCVEVACLAQILWQARYRLASLVLCCGATLLCFAVAQYDCAVTVGAAEWTGIVVDSCNLLLHVALWAQQRANRELPWVVGGFATHCLYLLVTLISFQGVLLSAHMRLFARLTGASLNLVVADVFSIGVRAMQLPRAGRMTLREWRRERRGLARALWTGGRYTLEDAGEAEFVSPYEPHVAAVAVGAAPARARLRRGLPFERARRVEGGTRRYLLTVPFATHPAVAPPADDALVDVLPWCRLTSGAVGLAVGIVLWLA